MPIRPENKDRYPPSWSEISARIRFERADGRCECLGQCGVDHASESSVVDDVVYQDGDTRCQAVHGWRHPVTRSKVVLTVAHLDFTPEHCEDENLLAMCQRCHNRYEERRRGMFERWRAVAALRDLFSPLQA